jgi:hypothetical protein
MATDDATLLAEIRLLTHYDASLIDDPDLQGLIDLAKRELLANTGDPNLDWYGNIATERSLFWLTCIFCKVKLGEIDAPSFKIGELDVDSYDPEEQVGLWLNNFWKNYWAIGEGAPIGHIKNNRSDRTYGFDN